MTALALAEPSDAPRATTRNAVILIAVGMMATTLAQPEVLAAIPLQNLLKNELHVPRAANAAFFFWMGLPWYLKPFAGILTDAFPLFGRRRATYLLFSATLAAITWLAIAIAAHRYGVLLWGFMALSLFMMIASTVIGGFMVEAAQAASESGRLTSVRMFVMRACLIVAGPVSGYLAAVAFGWTAVICAGVVALLVPATWLFLKEETVEIRAAEVLANAGRQLRRIAGARTMWAAAGLIGLFFIAPGFTTALFYRQQTELHMTTQAQGGLRLIGGCAGVLGALTYGWACRRFSLRRLLMSCLTLSGSMTLLFVFYDSVLAARIITALYAFGFVLAEIALLDLAIRATPAGSEGLGYALMISVTNLATFGTDWLGSVMMDSWRLPFWGLVLSNAATTFMAVPCVLLIPAVLVASRDKQPPRPKLALAEVA